MNVFGAPRETAEKWALRGFLRILAILLPLSLLDGAAGWNPPSGMY